MARVLQQNSILISELPPAATECLLSLIICGIQIGACSFALKDLSHAK